MDVTRCAPGELADHEDAMVRALVPAATRAWRGDGAVALVTVDAELREPMLLGVGTDAAVARIVAHAVDDGGAAGMLTVPYGTLPLLPERLRPAAADAWAWRAVDVPPPVRPGEERVAWLGEDDLGDIKALLTEANPGSSVWPGDGAARRWAGVRDGHGLRACLADTSRLPGVGHVSGIATAPDARGHSDNPTALRMYDRLGFTDTHRMASGRPTC